MTLQAGSHLGFYEILSLFGWRGTAEVYRAPGWLKIDPNFDPLRKNPRFQKLVEGGK